jgi:hypothetical protein
MLASTLALRVGLEDAMEIGKPKRKYTIEPLRDPVPRERPQRPVRAPAPPAKTPPARV